MTAPLCFLDTETDGVHPGRVAWEVAAIRREPDGTQTEHHWFVDIELDTADRQGLRIGGFYERHPAGRYLSGADEKPNADAVMGPYGAAQEIARATHGAVIVGINPGFDVETLDAQLRTQGLISAWDYTPICAKTYAHGYLAGLGKPVPPRWKTDDLPELLGLDPVPDDERHTALGDARLAMRVYDAAMAGAGAR